MLALLATSVRSLADRYLPARRPAARRTGSGAPPGAPQSAEEKAWQDRVDALRDRLEEQEDLTRKYKQWYYRSRDREGELRHRINELEQNPRNHTVEELSEALENADARIRFMERELEKMWDLAEERLMSNVALRKRLAELDPLFRLEAEERRKQEQG